VLVVGDPFYYALDGLKDQFKQESGIDAQIESISLEALGSGLRSTPIWNGAFLRSRLG
jgi:multiple sugar transport system substrate-binding protein